MDSLLKRTDPGNRNDLYVDALRNLFDLEAAAPQENIVDLEE